MRGRNKCVWLLMGKAEVCGKSCMGKYCSTHNAQITKGGGTVPCTGCGIGVKTSLALCRSCGADCARLKRWRNRQRIIRAEFVRLVDAGIVQDPQYQA